MKYQSTRTNLLFSRLDLVFFPQNIIRKKRAWHQYSSKHAENPVAVLCIQQKANQITAEYGTETSEHHDEAQSYSSVENIGVLPIGFEIIRFILQQRQEYLLNMCWEEIGCQTAQNAANTAR